MLPSENTEYFNSKKIIITDRFIKAGEQSYNISNIRSVEIEEKPANRGFGVMAVLLGAFIFICTVTIGIFDNSLLKMADPNSSTSTAILFSMTVPPLFCSVLSIGIGVLSMIMAKKHYSVKIDGIDDIGREVFTSGNRNEAETVDGVIKEAIQNSPYRDNFRE